LRPFPEEVLRGHLQAGKQALVVELCEGQMLQDVLRLATCESQVSFYGRMGGAVPTPFELVRQVQILRGRES
jgi:2-oxoglutarate ferredoxin oxidoreductase subunit alpha